MAYDLTPRDAASEVQKTAIQAIIDDLSVENTSYAVYVLLCHQPKLNEEMKAEIATYYPEWPIYPGAAEYGPGWAEDAINAHTHYYVGQTNDLASRLYQHVAGTSDSALFTTLFPPKSLVTIEFVDSQQEAKSREQEITRHLNYYGPADYSESDIDEVSSKIEDQLTSSIDRIIPRFEGESYTRRHLFEIWISEFLEVFSKTEISKEIEEDTAETLTRGILGTGKFGCDHWLLNEYRIHVEYELSSAEEIKEVWRGLTEDGVYHLVHAICMEYSQGVMAYSA